MNNRTVEQIITMFICQTILDMQLKQNQILRKADQKHASIIRGFPSFVAFFKSPANPGMKQRRKDALRYNRIAEYTNKCYTAQKNLKMLSENHDNLNYLLKHKCHA